MSKSSLERKILSAAASAIIVALLSVPSTSSADVVWSGKKMNDEIKIDTTKNWKPSPPVKAGGISVRAIELGPKAWQLLNPLAPRKYGFGRGMFVLNSQGKPKGFIVASVAVW